MDLAYTTSIQHTNLGIFSGKYGKYTGYKNKRAGYGKYGTYGTYPTPKGGYGS